MKAKYIWCTLRGHFLDFIGGRWDRMRRKKLGTLPPKKARCPDCGKQFGVQVTENMDGEHIYRIPPHKKRIK